MQRVTLMTIATECGISKYAVSRALSGKSGVSDSTRQRVLEAAERLGYQRPAQRERPVIAALFEDPAHVNSELHSQIQAGMQSEPSTLGFDVRPHWLHHGERIDQLLESSDGIAAINLQDLDVVRKVRKSGKQAVYSGWLDPLDRVDTISGTDHESGSAVARHLIELGHREIAYVNGEKQLRGRRERLYGLREEIELSPGCIHYNMIWSQGETFADALDALLEEGGRPTAFFCSHDGLALTVVTEMLSRGWSIPEDVSVVGFGDYSTAREIRPPLTTVKVMGKEIGRSIVHLLANRMAGNAWPGCPIRQQIVNQFILRGTTGPCRTHARLPDRQQGLDLAASARMNERKSL